MSENAHIPGTEIPGIPVEQSENIVSSGINFMRTITEAYGPDKGLELWDSISTTLGNDIKGAIFFSMIAGHTGDMVRMSGSAYQKISAIKAVRDATGMGLAEAKKIVEDAAMQVITLRLIRGKDRNRLVTDLMAAGMRAY